MIHKSDETLPLKKCLNCASAVPAEARVCAHCRSRLMPVTKDWWQASDGLLYPPWQHPDAKRPERQPINWKLVGGICAAFVAVVVLAALVSDPDEPAGGDFAASRACEEYGDLVDIAVYTDAELREQVQQVWDEAKFSGDVGIRRYAHDMLEALTVGDTVGFVEAAAAFGRQC